MRQADKDAFAHLKNVCIWDIEEFRLWARNALAVVRQVRKLFPGAGDLAWGADTANIFVENNISPDKLRDILRKQLATEVLTTARAKL